MNPIMRSLLIMLALATSVAAQNGIQWSSNPAAAVDRAHEMGVPVMFWVSEHANWDDDFTDNLRDAQQDAFRDPIVLAITEHYFVPCRVARNSRVQAEAERLGLPTRFGLYIAVITPTGEVLDQIDPAQVASPDILATRLATVSRAYRNSVYSQKLRPILTDPKASKSDLAGAVRSVWRMRIYSADTDVVALLSRPDLTPGERSRLYRLLATFGSAPCVTVLLDAAVSDESARQALMRGEPAALPTLLDALPTTSGEVLPRQLVAYRAVTSIVGGRSPRDDRFWSSAPLEERTKELERLRSAAQAVFGSWQEREGRWR